MEKNCWIKSKEIFLRRYFVSVKRVGGDFKKGGQFKY